MKVWFFIILYVFLSVFYVSAKELKIDNISVIVNNEIILNSDINQALSLIKQERQDIQVVPLRANFLRDKVIKKLILETLMLEEAKKKNLIVTKEQVNNIIKNIAFKRNITVDQLKNSVLFNNINSVFTFDDYTNNIKKLLTIKMIQDYEFQKRVHISDQEINFVFRKIINRKNDIKKIKFSYIFLPFLKEKNKSVIYKTKVLAENIVNTLQKGYDFENLYRKCKENTSIFSVKNMPWMRFIDAQKMFLNTLNIFKKGQILGPFLEDKGFYILKIHDIENNKKNIITEFHIEHCLIKPSVILTNLEAKKNIFNIYKNIKNKIYNFHYAVKHFSHDFYSYRKNGDLGWISSEVFPINFNEELFRLNKNEISKPIKSNFGWHIIRLLEKRKIDKYYKIEKDKAYNILLNRKIILARKNWINSLKKMAYIKIIRS